jgi:hypothetical protein
MEMYMAWHPYGGKFFCLLLLLLLLFCHACSISLSSNNKKQLTWRLRQIQFSNLLFTVLTVVVIVVG